MASPKSNFHLPVDVFMSELTLMFHNARNSGEVSVTMKKYDYRDRPYPKLRTQEYMKKIVIPVPLPKPKEYACLIRAKYKSKKITTVVSAAEALNFQLDFAKFMRSSMDALKKDRKPRRKNKKATQ